MNGVLALRFSSDLVSVPLSTLVNGTNMHVTKRRGLRQETALELNTFLQTIILSKYLTHKEDLVKVRSEKIPNRLERLLALRELENAS